MLRLSDEPFSVTGVLQGADAFVLNPLRDLAWSGLLDGIKFPN